ncbi:hypothetical protein C6I20_05250 [Aeromicrobium sp. A1-2]|uniref:hypothetical protein n=1 Tax=Aeromicrobium sp. A1-2 TaxID=2107713 RepID=UPI000E4A8CC4|nr:hypothetical protein [Aeromicrobium sp. A1-2]AXT84657.1 hypothetical protein C6I20_05250 [Aeromicrobium sp. A1-2]
MSLLTELRDSALQMPARVLVWLCLALVPANLAILLFLDEPFAIPIAALVFAGLLPNVALLVRHRRFTSVMGVPHVLAWVPLMPVVVFALLRHSDDMSTTYEIYLYVLLVVNGLSLAMDIPDAARWTKGERTVF